MINVADSDVTAAEGDVDQQQICVETVGVGVLTTSVIVAFALSGEASMTFLLYLIRLSNNVNTSVGISLFMLIPVLMYLLFQYSFCRH